MRTCPSRRGRSTSRRRRPRSRSSASSSSSCAPGSAASRRTCSSRAAPCSGPCAWAASCPEPKRRIPVARRPSLPGRRSPRRAGRCGLCVIPAPRTVHSRTAKLRTARSVIALTSATLQIPHLAPPASCTEDSKGIMELSRRDLLKVGLFGSAAMMLPAERIARTQLAISNRMPQSKLPAPFTMGWQKPPLATKTPVGNTDYFTIYQRQAQVQILPDKLTTIWGYADGVNGAAITPGPTIMVDQKRPAVVRQVCELPDRHPEKGYQVWTSTHLHGSCSLPQYDGYASDVTNPHQFKDYQYPNIQDARTLWYHDHGVHITANNAYMGLAAQYIMHDP